MPEREVGEFKRLKYPIGCFDCRFEETRKKLTGSGAMTYESWPCFICFGCELNEHLTSALAD